MATVFPWAINTDWTENATVSMVVNSPEVGEPITRMRSHNVKHAMKINVEMDYDQMHGELAAFMQNIGYGSGSFLFTSPVDSTQHTAYLDMSSGQPYTTKRKNDYLYTITFNLYYITVGAY